MVEVVPFEQDPLPFLVGKGIGKAIAKIELRFMSSAFAESRVGLSGDPDLRRGDGFEVYFQKLNRLVKPVVEKGKGVPIKDDACLEVVCARHQSVSSLQLDFSSKVLRFRLVQQNRYDR